MRHVLPLSLRQITYLSEQSLFSVQRSLKSLVLEDLIVRKAEGQRVLFSVNQQHAYYEFIKELYALEMKVRLSIKPKNLDKKAQSVLQFSRDAHALIQGVR